ncbi:MAG: hypothetical protein JNL07_10730 [Rhodospirillales bacterium]|nr:hypothetical protein [Rhodospirillales bacterium]
MSDLLEALIESAIDAIQRFDSPAALDAIGRMPAQEVPDALGAIAFMSAALTARQSGDIALYERLAKVGGRVAGSLDERPDPPEDPGAHTTMRRYVGEAFIAVGRDRRAAKEMRVGLQFYHEIREAMAARGPAHDDEAGTAADALRLFADGLLDLGEIDENGDAIDYALTIWREALPACEGRDDAVTRVRSRVRFAEALINRASHDDDDAKVEEARALLDEAVAWPDADGEPELARMVANARSTRATLGMLRAARAGGPPDAGTLDDFEAAAAALRALGDDENEAAAMINLASARLMGVVDGQGPAAAATLRRCVDEYRAAQAKRAGREGGRNWVNAQAMLAQTLWLLAKATGERGPAEAALTAVDDVERHRKGGFAMADERLAELTKEIRAWLSAPPAS